MASAASSTATNGTAAHGAHAHDPANGQVVLVLQGGGALGAYQAGVFQAMDESGLTPDWVIGTSIGAINAALIAGNRPEDRLLQMREFWYRVRYGLLAETMGMMPGLGAFASTAATMMGGLPGFFAPNPLAMLGPHAAVGCENASYYSTLPLARTLADLIDVDQLNTGAPRITVGATTVSDGRMRYFDSRSERLHTDHILASGALPPAFPAVRIDGELYWDGGIVSNTPVEAVFDDNPRRSGLVFAVHIWNPTGVEPDTISQVMGRDKDIRYASRADTHIARQKQIHKLRHVITELAGLVPPERRQSPEVRALAAWGCTTRLHVVRLLAPPLEGEDHSKDIDFSEATIRSRWDAGYADTMRVLHRRPWLNEFDPSEGFILHEAAAGTIVAEG